MTNKIWKVELRIIENNGNDYGWKPVRRTTTRTDGRTAIHLHFEDACTILNYWVNRARERGGAPALIGPRMRTWRIEIDNKVVYYRMRKHAPL